MNNKNTKCEERGTKKSVEKDNLYIFTRGLTPFLECRAFYFCPRLAHKKKKLLF